MQYNNHLYMTLYPNNALIASHLSPDLFARHYTSGSSRHYSGKVIFAHIDPEFRHNFFPIDDILSQLNPHEDGRPKATKFICSYRVMEHVSLSAIQKLFLVNQEGHSLELVPAVHDAQHEKTKIRLYAEITPMRMMALSEYDFPTFGRYITNPDLTKSAPVQFYTQLEVDIPEFVEDFESNPFRPSPIRNVHPSTLRDGYYELLKYPDKHNKGIALDSNLDEFSFKIIRHGFMFARQEETLYFPIPDHHTIEANNYKFFKTM
ncbi:MAG: hypothetical protein GW949_04640 [Spirochaetales bacterium]|nr:hypothetical protein [Spirochaetales bacterium]